MKKILLTLMLLSACSTREETTVNRLSMTPEDMLVQIHARKPVQNELVFQTIPDEALLDLREQAEQAQSVGDYRRTQDLLDQALKLNAKDPEALQMLAELAILQKSWLNAEHMALRSFQSGPKLGDLCRRNWLTVHYAQVAQGLPVVAHQLAKNLNACTIVPPVRM
jgi:uncharacterized protein HemY